MRYPRRRRSLRAALCGAVALMAPMSATGAGATPRDLVAPQVVPTSLDVLGKVNSPYFGSDRMGVSGVVVSPNGENIYGVDLDYLLDIDLPSMAVTGRTFLTGGPQGFALTPDRGTAWFRYFDQTANEYRLDSFALDTGVIGGSPISLGVSAEFYTSPMTVATIGGVDMAFVGFTGFNYQSAYSMVVAVNLDTGVASAPRNLTGDGFGEYASFGLAVSADGTELYISRGDQVMVYDPTDISQASSRAITLTGTTMGVYADGTSTKGQLYVADDILKMYDLDSDVTTQVVTLPTGARMLDITSGGDVVTAGYGSIISYVDATTGTLTTADMTPAQRRGGDPLPAGVHIDEDPTFGTCIFVANNNDESYIVLGVDGADCGAVGARIDPIDKVAVRGSSTVTYTPPTTGDRSSPWVAIGVYADCELVEVIEPPFSGSFTVDWDDVEPALRLSVRAYSQADLTAGSVTDLDTLTCDTSTAQTAETDIAYVTLAATYVAAGGYHSCAAIGTESYCWGRNGDAQLGNGTSDGESWTSSKVVDPITAPGALPTGGPHIEALPAGITDIAGGDYYNCALATGTVYCWGRNDSGQLGIGNQVEQTAPIAVVANDGFTNTNVTAMSVGKQHTCAIEGGSVYCWGDNYAGRTGNGIDGGDVVTLPAKVLPSGDFTNTGVTSVGAGWTHTCAVQSGAMFCWGTGEDGELGNNAIGNSLTPVKVADNPAAGFTNTGVSVVDAGFRHTCAVNAGKVYCWGSDSNGKLGWDNQGFSPLPIAVLANAEDGFSNDTVSKISIGYYTNCLIRLNTAYCWGSNGDRVLGIGEDISSAGLPMRVAAVDDGFTNAAVADIEVYDDHACAIDNALAYCWGRGDSGRLGRGSRVTSSVAVPVCCGTLPAEFDLQLQLSGAGSVTSDGGEVDCSATCTLPIVDGTTLRLVARPAAGYLFAGWGGACSGTGACVVTMSDAVSVTARFDRVTLPETGGRSVLVWWALGMLGAGLGLLVLTKRRPVASR